MSQNTAPERPITAPGEMRNFAFSFAGVLDSGELLTGTPTAVEQTSSDLTISNVAVNTSALTINEQSVPIGEAVQGKIVGQLAAHSPYTINVTASTDATPAQRFVKSFVFRVQGA